MGNDVVQFKAEEDGCRYWVNPQTNKWQKTCDIDSPTELPRSIQKQLKEARTQAEAVLALPFDD